MWNDSCLIIADSSSGEDNCRGDARMDADDADAHTSFDNSTQQTTSHCQRESQGCDDRHGAKTLQESSGIHISWEIYGPGAVSEKLVDRVDSSVAAVDCALGTPLWPEVLSPGPEEGQCHSSKENGYISDVDSSLSQNPGHCRRPTLESGDYIAILSHPQGLEKCFSVGPAALYDSEALEKQRRNFRKHRRLSTSHTGHPAVHLINDRFKVCKNRIYHAESTSGCSGAPVLLFKRSLRRTRIPVVDYSQHSGTCFFKNGEKLGFATCFTPSVFCQSRRASEDLQQCYSVNRQQEQISVREVRMLSKRFKAADYSESTHILNVGRVTRSKWEYRIEEGDIARKRKSADGCPRPVVPYLIYVNGDAMDARVLPKPAQFSLYRAGAQVEMQGGDQGNGLQQKNFYLDSAFPWTEKFVSEFDLDFSADFVDAEDIRSTRHGDSFEAQSDSFNGAKHQGDTSLHSLEKNPPSRRFHALRSLSGYTTHPRLSLKAVGKNSAKKYRKQKSASESSDKNNLSKKFGEQKIGADQMQQPSQSRKKHKAQTDTERRSSNRESWKHPLVLSAMSIPEMSPDDSYSGFSHISSETTLADSTSDNSKEQMPSSIYFPAISPDSGNSGACNKAATEVHAEEMSCFSYQGSPGYGLSAALKYENNTLGHVDGACTRQQATCRRTSGSVLSATFGATVSRSVHNSADACVPDEQEHSGSTSIETETDELTSLSPDMETMPSPSDQPVDYYASENDHPLSHSEFEKIELFSVSGDGRRSVFSDRSDDQHQELNNTVKTDISVADVNAQQLSEPTCSLTISDPDQPDSSGSGPSSPLSTETKFCCAEPAPTLPGSSTYHQPERGNVSFTQSSVDPVKGVNDNDEEQSLEPLLQADLELVTDNTLTVFPYDFDLQHDLERLIVVQSFLETNTEKELPLVEPMSEEDSQSGTREQREEKRRMEEFDGILLKSLSANKGVGGDSVPAKSNSLNDVYSEEYFLSEESKRFSLDKKSNSSLPNAMPEDSASDMPDPSSSTTDRAEGSYHCPFELPHPRSAYSLRDLKLLVHKRKRMFDKVRDICSQHATTEGPYEGARKNQTSLGLQEMAVRFLKMESLNINSSTGRDFRHWHLRSLEHFLFDVDKLLLVPNCDWVSRKFLNQPRAADVPRSASLPSCDFSQQNMSVQFIDKDRNLTTCPLAQIRKDLLYEHGYKRFPLFVQGKKATASQQVVGNAIDISSYTNCSSFPARNGGEDSGVFMSTTNVFDPVVGGHKKPHPSQISGRNIHLHAAQQIMQPRFTPAASSCFIPVAPKPSADAHLRDRVPRVGSSHEELHYAHPGPWLHVPVDRLRTPTESSSVSRHYADPLAAYLQQPDLGLDARASDRDEGNSTSRLKTAEWPTAVPLESGLWQGHAKLLAGNSSGFSQKCALSHRAHILGCPDPFSASTSSAFARVGFPCRAKTTDFSEGDPRHGSDAGDISASTVRSGQTCLPAKGLKFVHRVGYPGSQQGSTIVSPNAQHDPPRLGPTHIRPYSDALRTFHSDQDGAQNTYSFPEIWQDNPFPRSYSAAKVVMTNNQAMKVKGGANECVRYQHESAKFDGSLGSSPVVPSSTDNSFLSSPEIHINEGESVPEPWEQLYSARAPDLLTPWSSSIRTESKATFPLSYAAQCNPVKRKAKRRHHGLADTLHKLDTRRNIHVCMTKHKEAGATVPSLSKAFERFLSSDVEDEESSESGDESLWEAVSQSRQKPCSMGSFLSVRYPGAQARSIYDPLWINAGDIRQSASHSQPKYSYFSDAASRGGALFKIQTMSPKRATYLDKDFSSVPFLSDAFNRFIDVPAEAGLEASMTGYCRLPLKSGHGLAKASTECNWQNESHMYDPNDIVHVVLETGVVHQNTLSDPAVSTVSESTDNPQCNLEMHAHTGTTNCKPSEQFVDKTQDLDSDKPSPSNEKVCKLVCKPQRTYLPKAASHPQSQGVKPIQAETDMGYNSSNSEFSNGCLLRVKARQKTLQERPLAHSDLVGRAVGDSTNNHSTQSNSVLHKKTSGIPQGKRQVEKRSMKEAVAEHSTRHVESCPQECKSCTSQHPAPCPVACEELCAPSPQWQNLGARQSCYPEERPPLGWNWSNGSYPFCNYHYCMHWQVANPPWGFYLPCLQPQHGGQGCSCNLLTGHDNSHASIHPIPSFEPEAYASWTTADHFPVYPRAPELLLKELSTHLNCADPNSNQAYAEYACIPTVDAVDTSVSATLEDVGIVQIQFTEDPEEQGHLLLKVAKPRTFTSTSDPHQDHGSSGAASRHGKYVKMRSSRRNHYSRRGIDKVDDKNPAHQKPPLLPNHHHVGDDAENRDVMNDRSMSSVAQGMRVLSGQLSSDSSSEKSRQGVCYTMLPGDIRVRLEKAAKWIITQMFVCPSVHYLTPRDADVFTRQQNLPLTLDTMALFD